MKTTIDLSDALFYEAKARAASTGQTLRAMVEKGLRLALDTEQTETKVYHWPDLSVSTGDLTPAYSALLNDGDWSRIRDEYAYDTDTQPGMGVL